MSQVKKFASQADLDEKQVSFSLGKGGGYRFRAAAHRHHSVLADRCEGRTDVQEGFPAR